MAEKSYDFYVGKVENIVYVGKEEGDCEPGPGGRLEAKYFDTRKIPLDNWAIKMRWYLKYDSVASADAYYNLDAITTPEWICSGSLLASFSKFDEEKVFQFIAGTNKEVPTSAPVATVTGTVSMSTLSVTTNASRRSSRRTNKVDYTETKKDDTDIVDETLFRFSSEQLTTIEEHIGYVNNDPFQHIDIMRELEKHRRR